MPDLLRHDKGLPGFGGANGVRHGDTAELRTGGVFSDFNGVERPEGLKIPYKSKRVLGQVVVVPSAMS